MELWIFSSGTRATAFFGSSQSSLGLGPRPRQISDKGVSVSALTSLLKLLVIG